MASSRVRRLARSAEGVTHWAAAAPVLARLLTSVGHRVACWRGDRLFRSQAAKRAELTGNLRQVLGSTLSPAAARQAARRFRFASCEAIDVMRLRHRRAAAAPACRDPRAGAPGGRAGRR